MEQINSYIEYFGETIPLRRLIHNETNNSFILKSDCHVNVVLSMKDFKMLQEYIILRKKKDAEK